MEAHHTHSFVWVKVNVGVEELVVISVANVTVRHDAINLRSITNVATRA